MDLGRCVTTLVNIVSKGTSNELDPYDLAPIEFSLLRFCLERTECTATELAEELPIDASRISRLVNRLFDKGLLIRQRQTDDRRVVMLQLSDHGRELTTALRDRIQAFYARITEDVDEAEMDVFVAVTSKINDKYASLKPPH